MDIMYLYPRVWIERFVGSEQTVYRHGFHNNQGKDKPREEG
jgi:hypothetical protein